MMVFKPTTMSAVERVSSPVSSSPVAWGTGEVKSPATSSFIRSAQARMGTLILEDSFRATTMEARMEAAITARLMKMPKYVLARYSYFSAVTATLQPSVPFTGA